jgi:hypothetical protein
MRFICAISTLAMANALGVCTAGDATPSPPSLSKVDAALLESLIPTPLVDPRGKAWVVVSTTLRRAIGTSESVDRAGWMLPVDPKDEQDVIIQFADGEILHQHLAQRPHAIDLPSVCSQYADFSASTSDPHKLPQVAWSHLSRAAQGCLSVPPLALVAWLHALGHDAGAAQALHQLRAEHGSDPTSWLTEQMRDELAGQAFVELVQAYIVRADDEARMHGRRLLSLYPDLCPDHYGQATSLMDEIDRRHRTHHDEPPAPWRLPAEWAHWQVTRKVSSLIEDLDTVDVRQ